MTGCDDTKPELFQRMCPKKSLETAELPPLPIEVLEIDCGYRGFFQLNRYRLRHRLYAGGMSPALVRERIERLRAVAVLLYDPQLDQVVLIEQFRIGALEQGAGAWLLEIVGGLWEADLAPEAVAHQEALEEAGCVIQALLPIQDVWISPGTANERMQLYCGRVDATHAGGIHGVTQEGEDIRVVVLTWAAVQEALATGRINTAAALIAVQWLTLHRVAVRTQWSD